MNRTRSKRPSPLELLTLLALLVTPLVHSHAADGLSVDFDWSVPDRFGMDRDGDGLIDYHDTVTEVQPAAFRVDIDACESSADIEHFTIDVDGVEAGVFGSCRFSIEIANEGLHDIRITGSRGDESTSISRTVGIRDLLIVALGDSYASGEGVPDIPMASDAIAAYEELQGRFADANAALAGAAAVFAAAQAEFSLTSAKTKAVADALAALNATTADVGRYCKLIGGDVARCAQATAAVASRTADLASALGAVGLQALIDSVGAIEAAVSGLIDVAGDTLDVARLARDDAATLVGELGSLLEEAQRELVAIWQDSRPSRDGSLESPCHRSAFSGQALAALEIERADSKTSVTFVHISCSGGQIPNITGSGGQLDQALALIGGREIDALVVSIGGNDAGFTPIIKALIKYNESWRMSSDIDDLAFDAWSSVCGVLPFVKESCEAELANIEDKTAARILSDRITMLPGRFDTLADRLADIVTPDRVYLTEYPGAGTSDDGSVCDALTIPGISTTEWAWVDDTVAPTINDAVLGATEKHGWNWLDGILERYTTHGYCADERFFVRLEESLLRQGDIFGMAHPNLAGNEAYGEVIAAALEADLADDSVIDPPPVPGLPFERGDINADASIDISDAIAVLDGLFTGGTLSCEKSADVNDSGTVDISDPVRLLAYLFQRGDTPPAPFRDCGQDLTSDELTCERFDRCE